MTIDGFSHWTALNHDTGKVAPGHKWITCLLQFYGSLNILADFRIESLKKRIHGWNQKQPRTMQNEATRGEFGMMAIGNEKINTIEVVRKDVNTRQSWKWEGKNCQRGDW